VAKSCSLRGIDIEMDDELDVGLLDLEALREPPRNLGDLE
jgi:hypothetical protein